MSITIADHWAQGDVYPRILEALEAAGKDLTALTVEDLAPVDHFHARGFAATVELGDALPPVAPNSHLLDIGCGLGGPARYFAQRFECRVSGLDLTGPFVEAGQRLTGLLGLDDRVELRVGDAQELPYEDETFDGAYAQHVTMNVPDRPAFFASAFRVLRPGGFLALTEHGRGSGGELHHPVPWSEDGSGEYLVTPEQTREFLEKAGFVHVAVSDTGQDYLAAYRAILALADAGDLPPLGLHVLIGPSAITKARNSVRNIEEGATRPVRIVCQRPG